MDFNDLQRYINFDSFLQKLGYKIRKYKSCQKWRSYTNSVETIILYNRGGITYYFQPTGDRGNIINFCKNRSYFYENIAGHNLDVRVSRFLHQYLGISDSSLTIPIENSKKKFSIPTQYKLIFPTFRSLDTFHYLRSRGISSQTLNSEIFKNICLYFNENNYFNIAFPLYNTEYKINGLDLRNYNFKRFAKHSDKSHCVWLSTCPDHAKEIVICESPIDCLSFHQLYRQGSSEILYISTGGNLTYNEVKTILSILKEKITNHPQWTIAFDNDRMGRYYTAILLLSLIENKSIYSQYNNQDHKMFAGINNITFISYINNLNEEFKIHNGNLIYQDTDSIIQSINQKCLEFINSKMSVAIKIPTLKDVNDDLRNCLKISPEKAGKYMKTLNQITMNKQLIIHDDLKEVLKKMGFDLEKLGDKFKEKLLTGIRSDPVGVNVTDVLGKTKSVAAKIQLYKNNTGATMINVEYAQPRIDFKKPFWGHTFTEKEIKQLLKYNELWEPIDLKFGPSIIGIDTHLNLLRAIPLKAITIHAHYLGQDLAKDERDLLKHGVPVYKENLKDNQGKNFNSVLYYSHTKDKVCFATPTPELLIDLRTRMEDQINFGKIDAIKNNLDNVLEKLNTTKTEIHKPHLGLT